MFTKNIPKYLDELSGFIDDFVASLQAKSILINNVAFSVVDPITAFATTVFKIFKASSWKKLSNLGVSMLKSEEGIYTFLYNGQNIAQDLSKTQAEEFLKEVFTKIKDKGDATVKKYLDEVLESIGLRKVALEKYFNKFDDFHRHFDGEIAIKKLSRRDNTPALWLEGAHNYLVNGKKVNITTIRKPLVNNLDDIPNDVPFLANVEMRFSNRFLPKRAISSFFPKNWDITKIKEEVALIYDDLVKTGKNFDEPPYKYKKMNSEKTFEILIEFDKQGNITSAYPFNI